MFFTLILMILVSCDFENNNVVSISERVNIPNIKLSIDVIIKSRLDKSEITELANEIYDKYDGHTYDNVFIEYTLPGMIYGNGIYATSHFMPQLQVQFFGLTDSESSKIINSFKIKDRFWYDDNWRMILQIIKENEKYYLKKYAYDLTSGKEELIRKVNSTDTLYYIPDAVDNAYYLIDSSNELSIFDEQGFVYGFLKK